MASRVGQMLVRKFSTSQAMRSAGASPETVKLWGKLTIFGAFPCMALIGVYVFLEHQAEEAHHVRPEFVKREYMYIRTRRFPWGDGNHTLFHNKHVNALPDGYEDE
uniref:Cytochrome c oxidase subunit 6A1, mitochondrial n=1 Tax=Cacopsylla melanoneura TaxID=428564 RepID=A0A8D8QD07_9HEMI